MTQALARVDAIGEASYAEPIRRRASSREPGEAFAALLAGLGAGRQPQPDAARPMAARGESNLVERGLALHGTRNDGAAGGAGTGAVSLQGASRNGGAALEGSVPGLRPGPADGRARAAESERAALGGRSERPKNAGRPSLSDGANGEAASGALSRGDRAAASANRDGLANGAARGDGRNARIDQDARLGQAAGEPAAAARARLDTVAVKGPELGVAPLSGRSGLELEGVSAGKDERGRRLTVVDLRLRARRGESSRAEGDGLENGAAAGRADGVQGSPLSAGGGEPKGDAVGGVGEDGVNGAFDGSPDGSAWGGASGEASGASSWRSSWNASYDGTARPSGATAGFAENLAARLRDGAADMVRSAQIALRDGDSGLIRLRLEPETLGGVKIELKMTDKQVSGRIVVESDLAGEAFRSSLDALKDAFAEAGLSTTSLEVEVRNGMASGADGGRGDGRGRDSGEASGPYWSRSLKGLESAVPSASRGRDGLLDVVV